MIPQASSGGPRASRPSIRAWFSPGLEARLVLCFMLLLTAALGASFWTFVSGTGEAITKFVNSPAQLHNLAQIQQSIIGHVGLLVLLIGAVATLVSLTMTSWLVHRIFHPIRELVTATDRISQGDMEACVQMDRGDVIGTLARSFNQMVQQVRFQQQQLARANRDLADANARLSDSNHDLEQMVRQRTAEVEMTARQLEAANHRLSSEVAEKEEFLRMVSHDLNAPLRNIAGMAAALLMKHRDSFNPDVIYRLQRIQKNVEIETELVAELLELSRIKTLRHRIEKVDLNALLRELAGQFEQDLETADIRFTIDSPLPELYCERVRLRQVFQNLIDNSIKYMGEGMDEAGRRVKEIHAGCAIRQGEAEFYLRDTGMGVREEDAERVFHVFRRGGGEAVQNVAGKGVGLASVKSIIETYNGTIWIESQVGRGCTVRFTINGKYLQEPAPDAAPAPQAA